MTDVSDTSDAQESANALLEAGIARYRANETESAATLLQLAEVLFQRAGDTWNAGVARQWLYSANQAAH